MADEKQGRYEVGSPVWRTTNNRDAARQLGGVLADRVGASVPIRDTQAANEWAVAPDGRMTQTQQAEAEAKPPDEPVDLSPAVAEKAEE